jgi:hypothetical protein
MHEKFGTHLFLAMNTFIYVIEVKKANVVIGLLFKDIKNVLMRFQ